ncbi:hypothetical protein J4477_00610 [Candidatus Pacearchaeota archaeon]|nr:hypothetical protein [Candidatus Pacearchaeota archaeon]
METVYTGQTQEDRDKINDVLAERYLEYEKALESDEQNRAIGYINYGAIMSGHVCLD